MTNTGGSTNITSSMINRMTHDVRQTRDKGQCQGYGLGSQQVS